MNLDQVPKGCLLQHTEVACMMTFTHQQFNVDRLTDMYGHQSDVSPVELLLFAPVLFLLCIIYNSNFSIWHLGGFVTAGTVV